MAGLQAVVSLVPAARRLLGTTPLNIADLMVIGAGVLLPLLANEATKPSAPAEVGDTDEIQAEYPMGDAANITKEKAS
jgi:hypothetical protein